MLSFRVLTELVNKMRDMQMDKTELGCLRAIVLFNPGRPAGDILVMRYQICRSTILATPLGLTSNCLKLLVAIILFEYIRNAVNLPSILHFTHNLSSEVN